MIIINTKRLIKNMEKESKKSEKEIKDYLKKLIERDLIAKNNIIEDHGILKVNGYEFEYVIVGRKVKNIRLI